MRKESAAPKCRGGNCEKWKLWHNVVGVENAAQDSMDSQRTLSTTLVIFSIAVGSLHVDWLVVTHIKTNKNLRFSRHMTI